MGFEREVWISTTVFFLVVLIIILFIFAWAFHKGKLPRTCQRCMDRSCNCLYRPLPPRISVTYQTTATNTDDNTEQDIVTSATPYSVVTIVPDSCEPSTSHFSPSTSYSHPLASSSSHRSPPMFRVKRHGNMHFPTPLPPLPEEPPQPTPQLKKHPYVEFPLVPSMSRNKGKIVMGCASPLVPRQYKPSLYSFSKPNPPPTYSDSESSDTSFPPYSDSESSDTAFPPESESSSLFSNSSTPVNSSPNSASTLDEEDI